MTELKTPGLIGRSLRGQSPGGRDEQDACRQQRWPGVQSPSKLDLGVTQHLVNSLARRAPVSPLPLLESQHAEEDEPSDNPTTTPCLLSGTRHMERFIIISFYRWETKALGVKWLACHKQPGWGRARLTQEPRAWAPHPYIILSHGEAEGAQSCHPTDESAGVQRRDRISPPSQEFFSKIGHKPREPGSGSGPSPVVRKINIVGVKRNTSTPEVRQSLFKYLVSITKRPFTSCDSASVTSNTLTDDISFISVLHPLSFRKHTLVSTTALPFLASPSPPDLSMPFPKDPISVTVRPRSSFLKKVCSQKGEPFSFMSLHSPPPWTEQAPVSQTHPFGGRSTCLPGWLSRCLSWARADSPSWQLSPLGRKQFWGATVFQG